MNVFRQAFGLLPDSFKKKSAIFVFLLLISSILEAIGIGLILPILSIVLENDSNQSAILLNALSFFNIQDPQNILLAVLIIFVSVYVLKNLYLIFFYYWQNKFSFSLYKKISTDLFKSYIKRPILFHFSKNSSELVRNVFQECKNFSGLVNSYLKLIVECTILLSISLILFYFEPKATAIVFLIVGICSITFVKLTKKRVYKLGETRQVSGGVQLKTLQQGFGAIKDIKLKSSEDKFINDYKVCTEAYAKASYLHSTIIELPKIWLEIIFVVSLSIFLILLKIDNYNAIEMLPFAALFTGAAFRIIPCVNRIVVAIQSINFNKPALEKIAPDLNTFKDIDYDNNLSKTPLNFNNVLKLENLTFFYPGNHQPIIKNFSLEIKKNDYLGIIGKSGMGKSTTIDIIMGLLKPKDGKILVDNIDIQENIKVWQKKIGYVSQSIYLIDDSIRNNIAFGIDKNKIDNRLIENVSKDAQIFEFIKSLKKGFGTEVGERGIKLSGGQIQRIGIARELYFEPELIILDEATSSLDQETESEFLKCLENLRNRKTIIFVSHRKSALKNCNKIIEIN